MKQDNLNLVRDDKERVRAINHNQAPVTLAAATPKELAQAYLREVADVYDINTDQMGTLDLELRGDLKLDETASFRLEQEKQAADNTVVSYTQTYFSLPVRQAGIDVVMQNNPLRVLSSSASFYHDIEVKRPEPDRLDRFRVFSAEDLAKLLRSDNEPETLREIKINQTRFVVYKYDAKERQLIDTDQKRAFEPLPTLSLPKVPDSILDGNFYVTLETYFTMSLKDWGSLNWLALIEVETGAILYLRALVAHAQGYVFLNDPVTESGNSTNTPSSNNAVLNPFRDDVTLQGLNPPSAAGDQALSGSLITLSSTLATAPTTTSPFNFYYNVRTNNFSAVNAYYNCDRFFRLISDLGIDRAVYMDGTSFPISVNQRSGNSVNARCLGDATGDGVGVVEFQLADSSDTTTNPLGIACDWTVVLHEIGGHGILYDHINRANLGFSHSQGDSFAAILGDSESALTGADRFVTFPFVRFWDEDIVVRRHDRSVAAGWGWGGANDNNFISVYAGYKSEQVLSTTLFRLYRSMGGDAADVNQRRFAARFACYLILKTVGLLTSTSPAAINKTSQTDYVPVTDYETRMETADLANFTPVNPPETHTGGAYLKVIRWAFEKQGLFRAAGAPVTAEGSPPPVDVYINDGRNGEYQYLANHWSCQDIWNRTGTTGGDGGGVHQEPIVGETNRAYVRIKNRGSQIATTVVVSGYHCLPGVGLTYPADWIPMTDASLPAPNIAANDNVGIVVGPFRWIPSQLEHECMFFSVSANNDPSNIDGRITGSIPEWRLVPHDNNIAQRNVAPVAGGGGAPGLRASFNRRPFWLKNTFGNEAEIKLVPTLPEFLTKLGWKLEFINEEGGNFRLVPEKRKEILLSIKPGQDFSKELVLANSKDSLITVTAYANGIIIGGMSYHVDPNIKMPGEHTKDERTDRRQGILEKIWLWLKRLFLKLFNRE